VRVVIGMLLWAGAAWALAPSERLMLAGRPAEALEAALAEATSSPDDVAAQERVVDILLTLKLYDRAVAVTTQQVEQRPMDPDVHYLFARAVPDVQRAQRGYERALKLDPLHARAHMGMGAIHTARQDLDAALAAYGRAVRIDPSLSEAWLGLLRSQVGLEQIDAAIATARKAIDACPESAEAYLALAVLAPDEAIAVLERAVVYAGEDARVHAALAEERVKAGDGTGALAATMASLAIDPTQPVALRLHLFAGAMAAGALDVAGYDALTQARSKGDLAAAERLVERYPAAVVAWLTRSQLRVQRGDVDGGIADLEQALRLAPDEPEVLGQLGILLADRKAHARAAPLLTRAFAQRPSDVGLGRAAGLEVARAGDPARAITMLRELHERTPYASEVAIALADVLLLAGERERAYQVVLAASERRMDEQLLVALVATASQAGRYREAAAMLQQIGTSTQNARALELAEKLREKADQAP
jgi:tetratricopeptide (TPR) repeat protein